jgi:hypothetical protein
VGSRNHINLLSQVLPKSRSNKSRLFATRLTLPPVASGDVAPNSPGGGVIIFSWKILQSRVVEHGVGQKDDAWDSELSLVACARRTWVGRLSAQG